MITSEKTTLTVEAIINAPVERVWSLWNDPKHIIYWNNASEDWYTPRAQNDLRVGGKFVYRMESRDGSYGFDFEGEYDNVILLKKINYTLGDGRSVQISFTADGNQTVVTETFETEQSNPLDFQQEGWQAILNNFRKYVEKSGKTEVLHYELLINAEPEKVYQTMIDQHQYTEWTSVFNPTSHFKGSWEKGAKILFIGESQDGGTGGMVSRIKENIPNRFISIEHLGIIEHGKEVLCGPEVDAWAGALENYSFSESDGKTLVCIDADTVHKFKSYFDQTWPKALQKLKSMCESSS
jgi:uncharacterized protein YndB with AHSA1/START domain